MNEHLMSIADVGGISAEAWYRVAPCLGGIEIDLDDESNTRVRVTANSVVLLRDGSPLLFHRTPISRPLVEPAEDGDLDRLNQYLNLTAPDILLLKAWMSYTLAHPKQASAKFPILVLQGEQGTGKSFLCRIIQTLIDPNDVGVQILPGSGKDLAIAARNAHVLAFDNVRGIPPQMADLLCIASSGGALTSRRLYTDADQSTLHLHAALIINGIHDFVTQSDLAQRCLPLHLKSLASANRQSERDLIRRFQADLPTIFRGLLDLISAVFAQLPSAEPIHNYRMIDFTHWLAAMEHAEGIHGTPYQDAYTDVLRNAQRETLLNSPLAAALLAFAEKLKVPQWEGTPTQLLDELNDVAPQGTEYWRYWPKNPISLSKRLQPLMGGLREQGVDVQISRGKQRRITITVAEDFDHA